MTNPLNQAETMKFEQKLIKAGVKNLREFGYPEASEANIFSDYVYATMFRRMLDENLGHGKQIDDAILALKKRVDAEIKEP